MVVAVGVSAGAVLWAQSPVTHEVDGWCLSYDRDKVTYTTSNSAANGPTPFFLVPSGIPTLRSSDDVDATGLNVHYSKWTRGPLTDKSFDNCGGTVLDNGLVAFPPRLPRDPSVRRDCPGSPFHESLLPAKTDPLANQILIWCSPDPIVVACRMADRMPNGWEAVISLPKTHVDQWREASVAARAYFDEFLTDCGERE
ncbi:MAG: hypothetical protein DI533_12095 [Cereibacter sphaeroides]|uniref:Uncharacterized protein n=1 Tax=Cereibacter sphaeroides TaxID=1063 RepID=A0A2W5SAF2_CERSP|nr:MAG: hypothetical protein DI533_12095 [Cereibacter sphaeroides]